MIESSLNPGKPLFNKHLAKYAGFCASIDFSSAIIISLLYLLHHIRPIAILCVASPQIPIVCVCRALEITPLYYMG